MNKEEILQFYSRTCQEDPSVSEAIVAIKTLIECIRHSRAETLSGLRVEINEAIATLLASDHDGLVTSIQTGCELFLRFITLCSLDSPDFRRLLIQRGEIFVHRASSSRAKIARVGHPFVQHGMTILTHSRSRVVLSLLTEALKARKQFTVYVTESRPDNSGALMHANLTELGIPSFVILDSAVGYIMEKIDLVLVGAEGVMASGGIINKVGTYTMAVCAKALHKPVYVVAESFKFAKTYPLNQKDVPNEFKYAASKLSSDLSEEHPMVDYTPPAYITLLFTDLGILTPSAVSDQLIQLIT